MILQVIYVSSGMRCEVLFDDKLRIGSTIGGTHTFILNNCVYLKLI